jgi:hypothetical protein
MKRKRGMRDYMGRRSYMRRKREKQEREKKLKEAQELAKKNLEAQRLKEEQEEINKEEVNLTPDGEVILNSYTIHIPKPDYIPKPAKPTKPITRSGRILKWIKKHVRPDVGITPFEEGEGPSKNDDLKTISGKLKENLRVGLKITWKF